MRDSISSCCGSVADNNPQEKEQGHVNNHTDDNRVTSCCAAEPAIASPLSGSQRVDSGFRTPIRIMQMDCPTEEALIRKKLGTMPDVISLEFNLMQRVLMVEHTEDALEAVLAGIRSLGFEPEVSGAQGELPPKTEPKKSWWPLGLAAVAALMAEVVGWLEPINGLSGWLSGELSNNGLAAVLALIAVGLSGLTTYKKGWVAVRHGDLNINALMSIAVTGALILGQWPEAAMVMVLFTLAELIEAKSLDRARNAIAGLMNLAPEKATVQQSDGSWLEVAAATVAVGSRVRVKPGERIALDGEIVRGRSTLNQAPITGESLPVDKAEGDQVYAGTINESGSFEYKVSAAADDSALARIIHAVEEAQGAKAPTQRFVDQFARLYTPIVFFIALAVAVVPPLLMGGDWFDWVYKALVLLVIACPCALVISTPVTIVSGLAAAARRGILIKGGVYLEEGHKLSWLALDKTGTLTHGKPVLTEFEVLIDPRAAQTAGHTIEGCYQLAASLAMRSDHPVSQAIAKAEAANFVNVSTAQKSPGASLNVDSFEAIPGRGVKGRIKGRSYSLGNHRLIEESGLCSSALEARLGQLEREGKSVVMLVDDQQVLALFAVADTVKATSREAVAELHQLGIKTIMLTGDNQHTATAIAQQVGIDEARGNQLPEDKLAAITALEKDATVGMVGDGINDAPALARAQIGFAMGAMGSDTAIETADVALMDDDLRKVPAFVRLSRQTRRILIQNIALALGIKAVFLVLTVMGLGTMWMAVFADMGASLLVVGNGLRLLRK
ncbi:heavy metal translocating P-type ATPase [Neptunomonas qingdaonensis]|uniref:Cd2+/Zn2+-exporting ATPase n=1 Tax=Neptunomonas qingdaonensis TaxID=1045558 RepID=A0A1I2VGU8_9GAMM|nr:heavy metal translocating P-type ATPase [Neptunomonas qingdaonensis]SFG86401.1 Cd2+/Zn2+-exporting ATPase [Neptunomonas qingdaonensis]